MSENTIGAKVAVAIAMVGLVILVISLALHTGFISVSPEEPAVTNESASFETEIENEFLSKSLEVRTDTQEIEYFVGESNATGEFRHSLPNPDGMAKFSNVELDEGYTITAYRSNGSAVGTATISTVGGGTPYQDRAWIGILLGILLIPIGFCAGIGVDIALGNELSEGGESDVE